MVLFEEDFDLPPPVPEPEPALEPELIEPVFTAAELAAARAEAWREADAQARDELAAASETAARTALAGLGAQFIQAAAEARTIAESTAEAIAHLVLAGFAAAFPALCARHGDAEVQAVLRRLLPSLYNEPKVTIRVAAATLPAAVEELARLDPDLTAQVQVLPAEGLLPGDVRVAWRAGQATRDTTRLWQEIEEILAPAGLLPSGTAPPHAASPQTPVKEAADAR